MNGHAYGFHLFSLIFLIFLDAGVISTSSVLQCFVLLLLHHPEVKAKVEAEIKDVVGDERLPSLADKAAMPYLQATLLEVMRYVTVGPLSVPHYTTTDTTLKGYHIPKGTQVLTNFWALFHDERQWEDPWTFRPERFLDDHGHLLHPDHPRRQWLEFLIKKTKEPHELLFRSFSSFGLVGGMR
jgi:cytochrome P450